LITIKPPVSYQELLSVSRGRRLLTIDAPARGVFFFLQANEYVEPAADSGLTPPGAAANLIRDRRLVADPPMMMR